MDQSKLRKNHSDYRHSDALPSPQKPCNKKKSRHKNNAYQLNCPQGYDLGFTPYTYSLPPRARIHPSSQMFPTSDQSVCHYPVPLSFSLEHVSLPIYSPLIQPGSATTAPLERVVRINRTTEHKIPGIFQTFKQNHEAEQDYTSLPPVNCDLNLKKPKDEDSTCKRRFSDPGVAQISSEEESGSRSGESSNNSSLQDLHVPYAYGLIEQVNELRENNSQLTRELHEIKLEMESLKMLSASWKLYSDNIQPGKLSESIVELREAIKVNEEAFTSKMTNLFEKNSAQCDKAHRQLRETIDEKMNERLARLGEQVRKLTETVKAPSDERLAYEDAAASENILTIQQQLVDSEREKLSLRKELQEAIDSRKKAEEDTLRLERLVSVLRKKINGVSQESCMEEKQNPTRPRSTSFEQNPFIIANNKQSQKANLQKRTMGHRKVNSDSENGENDPRESEGSGPSAAEGTSLAPQVTITGPVTDL